MYWLYYITSKTRVEKVIRYPIKYSILSLVEHQGTVEICSPYPEFVLTGVLSIKKALNGTKSVRINRVRTTRVYGIN